MNSDRRQGDRRQNQIPVQDERRQAERRGATRRRHPRVPLQLWMEEECGNDLFFRRTANVSEGGAFFDRAIPHPVGTQVTLKFNLPDSPELLVARAQVVHNACSVDPDGVGMSVQFTHIEGNGQQRLHDYIHGVYLHGGQQQKILERPR